MALMDAPVMWVTQAGSFNFVEQVGMLIQQPE
jgi:hypothetical protein